MASYFITTGSPMAAVSFHDFLRDRGFNAHGPDLAQTGSFVVLGTSKSKLEMMAREAKRSGVLEPPFSIRVKELNQGQILLRS